MRPEKCIRQSAWSEGGGWRYWLTDGEWTVTLGCDDQLLSFATFTYGDQTRTWTGPEGEQTQYHLDDHQHIRAVQKYDAGTLYSQISYWWIDLEFSLDPLK